MTPRIEREVAEWPGAAVGRIEKGRTHQRLFLSYAGRERFVSLPTSCSDQRAEHNKIRDVRKVLSELGASRNERRKAKVRRARNRPDRNPLATVARAPVKPNPFEALAQLAAQGTPTQSAETTKIGSVRRMVARWLKAMRPTFFGKSEE